MTFITFEQRKAMLSVSEVSDLLGVCQRTVYKLIHSEELPAIKVRHTYRIAACDLRDYIERADKNCLQK